MSAVRTYMLNRLPAATVATVALIALLAVGALTPMSQKDAESLIGQFEDLLPTLIATPAGIFFNNLLASLLMMIPAAGIALAGFIVYNTGAIIGAYSTVSGVPVAFAILIPFLTAYGFVEMLAYGFAVSQSYFFASSAAKKRFRQELRLLPFTLLVVVSLLLLGAVLEWVLIFFFQQGLPS